MSRPRPRKERKSNLRDLSVPIEELLVEVYLPHAGWRLDSFLAEHFPWRSKVSLQQRIADELVSVDRLARCKKSSKLQVGDRIRVALPPPTEEVRHQQIAEALDIIYEDEHLVALSKPPGLVVHPVGKIRNNTLIQGLHWHYRRGAGRTGERVIIPKICHRLDRGTSGIMLVAKTDRARREIQFTFQNRAVTKAYKTVLVGELDFESRPVHEPIGPDPAGTHGMKMAVRPDGMASRSRFELIAKGAGLSLCRVWIETGRQHQIRVHAAHLGHPVLCDTLYGDPAMGSWPSGEPVIRRQALHAEQIKLPHPVTEAPMTLRAPIPPDLAALSRLIEEAAEANRSL